MSHNFVPRNRNAEIKLKSGRPESIGEFVRPLKAEEVKSLLRESVHQIVEYDTVGNLACVPVAENYEYWKWAQPHLAKDERIYLDSFPEGFALTVSEWRGFSGKRLIVFEGHH